MDPVEDERDARRARRVSQVVKTFEYVVVLFLMLLLMIVTAVCAGELAWMLAGNLTSGDVLLLDLEETFELFGFFLLVLIGMELLATLKSYLYERVVHMEVVLEVALIAVAQKIIILDTSRSGGPTLLGLAAMVVALAVAFGLIRRRAETGRPRGP